ncbi:MAG: sigma-70 family RNA polymerase sigma factor [Acidobacteria bacterium]|nr:sigma-70 family RNA polymerase sigma factor [Acidobacteriota bacterium]
MPSSPDQDTAIGGAQARFPATRWSAIAAARSPVAAERTLAFETLVAAYWKPVYKYIRVKWGQSNEDAKDLTQGFFARAFEKDFFRGYDPSKGSFRTYMRTCAGAFVANEQKATRRIKRGGDTVLLSLDFEGAEGEIGRLEVPARESLDDYFHKEWIRNLFSLAVEKLQEECEARGKQIHFRLFERYDLEDGEPEGKPTYEQLAAELGLSATAVTNYLAFARREFRRIVIEELREVTTSDEEFRSEARLLLGLKAR